MTEPTKNRLNELKPPAWLDENERKIMFDSQVDSTDTAFFGFKKQRTHEKVKSVLSHFNRVAPKYDFMNSVLSFGIHHAWKRTAIRMLDLKPGEQLLDVCGGTGDLAVLSAARVGHGGHIFIYDINRAMMTTGRDRPENQDNRTHIHYIEGDAEQIACRENWFDAAIVGFGIRNLTHLEKGFQEMYRVLKPGGKVMCLEFSKPTNPLFRWLYDFYSFNIMPFAGSILAGSRQSYACLSQTIRMFASPDELKEILEGIGFEAVSYKRLTNGIAVIHMGRKPLTHR
ncbi:MAG: bifunctional demethylmenaquinone methyltransferase/2-methoxy-6-polyprenyl-1,4-benzoquinol methylase UbiE [Desulfobacterales bacterium]|nr:bifunctional demethylmenaquinone methyltransferase/2-methoxy-6-polyprenyl-1,4-benzoquinol methylase UbiE [Desulfobacterales bacterium]MDX2511229.1 bifunctional demethylmenaquinone methyltransferase/2-methoxy-6-polyprenyl-1,4-benzoquinol methylase UbiE [Desulfobacterales bacterium]